LHLDSGFDALRRPGMTKGGQKQKARLKSRAFKLTDFLSADLFVGHDLIRKPDATFRDHARIG
jgi:hypothetical protein